MVLLGVKCCIIAICKVVPDFGSKGTLLSPLLIEYRRETKPSSMLQVLWPCLETLRLPQESSQA